MRIRLVSLSAARANKHPHVVDINYLTIFGEMVRVVLAVACRCANCGWGAFAQASLHCVLVTFLMELFFGALIVAKFKKFLPTEIGTGLPKLKFMPSRLFRALDIQ